MSGEPIYFDQYDYQIDDNPYPVMRRMRDEAPVWYNEKHDYWAISRFEDVLKASLDTGAFSSAYKTVLEHMTEEPSHSTMILDNDPPYHTLMRKLVAPYFSPARVSPMEDRIRAIVISYLEPLEGRDAFDFVQDFARWIPMDVVSELLGIPAEDRRQINLWADEMLHRDDGQVEDGPLQLAAIDGLMTYFGGLMASRRREPQDDLSSAIANGTIVENGIERRLTDQECAEFLMLIGGAGNETVARLLASAGWLLGKHPEQRRKLCENSKLTPRAVEELLRFETPSPVQFRRVVKDVELHGVRIPAGSNLCLMTSSAGRDDRQYESPDNFNIERAPRRHLTFGYGVHTCLGVSVARLEARVTLEEVLKRFPDWTVDESRMQRVRTSTVRGFSHVPVIVSQPDGTS